MKYEIEYKGKKYYHNADNTAEAATKFGNRKVFGRSLVENLRIRQFDAQTRGGQWAVYSAGWADETSEVVISIRPTPHSL